MRLDRLTTENPIGGKAVKYKYLALLVCGAALILTPGCRRTGGGPAYYGGGENENVVEGSTVVGEIVPADEDVGEQVDEFAGGGEFSTSAAGAIGTPEGNKPGETSAVASEPVTTYGGGLREGYRVQIVASSYQDNANAIAEKVKSAFPGVNVYVVHIQNLYKVRVGDYLDRAAAESMRDKLKNAGYADAWIVKEQVNAP